jgi:CRISPR-associated protein Csd1
VNGVRPTDLPAIKEFWAGRDKTKHEAVCLVTGKFGPVVDRMPAPIKGVPDGQSTGTAFISVNNASGCSYGLQAALNSPVGKATAEKIGNALNYLLASDKHSLRVGKVVYVYWTRNPEEFDLFQFLNTPRAEDVQQLLLNPKRGRESGPLAANDFFVLSLSANVSRIVVRDYHETTLGVVKANLANWFARLRLEPLNGGDPEPMGVFRLSVSLFREAKDMPAHVPVTLLQCALAGTPLPESLLGLAVKRNLAMQGPYTVFKKKRMISEPRLAIIKAIIQQKEEFPLEALNPQHPDSAYHCGRLLALLERIQRVALGDINATVVDRFYGAACSSPGSILGNLVNDAQPHLAKLRKDRRDFFLQTALEEVLSAIGQEFPRTLDLRRQGLFALGFYHQKAHDRAQAVAAKNANKKEGENA